MIVRPNNWNEVREFSERPKLPLGAYVCKVKKVAVQNFDRGGSQLCILFDICEGDYAGFYDADFKANQNADKKWKGILRQWLPRNDGSEKDEWTKSLLKGMVTAFEKSNPGFMWNWDEQSLVGKCVGILFRNEEWEYEGKTGWTVKPFRAISVDSVRNAEFTLPKDKPLENKTDNYGYQGSDYSSYSSNSFAELDDDDGDLPF